MTSTPAVTDTVYNKVFNTAERTFKLEGLTESWIKAAYEGLVIGVYDISGNHVESLQFRNVLHTDPSLYEDLEAIITKAANNLQNYASIKQDLISATESKVYTCDETFFTEIVTSYSTPLETAIPSKIVIKRIHKTLDELFVPNRDFKVGRNEGSSRKPVLDLRGWVHDPYTYTHTISPRNIALYQAQLALLDDTAETNSEALETTTRASAMQEREIEEKKRKTNMLMLMAMFG